jgi:hypothetical protein
MTSFVTSYGVQRKDRTATATTKPVMIGAGQERPVAQAPFLRKVAPVLVFGGDKFAFETAIAMSASPQARIGPGIGEVHEES